MGFLKGLGKLADSMATGGSIKSKNNKYFMNDETHHGIFEIDMSNLDSAKLFMYEKGNYRYMSEIVSNLDLSIGDAYLFCSLFRNKCVADAVKYDEKTKKGLDGLARMSNKVHVILVHKNPTDEDFAKLKQMCNEI